MKNQINQRVLDGYSPSVIRREIYQLLEDGHPLPRGLVLIGPRRKGLFGPMGRRV